MSSSNTLNTLKFLVFGGGGKVARHFARIAVGKGHGVVSVVRGEEHIPDLRSLGATPALLSLESASVPALTDLLTTHSPDIVIFAAGAGGKGAPERTRAVDYDGAVKVYDAMEAANVKRLILVGAVDIRDQKGDWPGWYDEQDKQRSKDMWGAIGKYCQAKYDAEVELHKRKSLSFTVVRPGTLTLDPAGGAKMGRTHLGKTSRELVAQTILAIAQTPGTDGLTIDVMDGDDGVEGEVERVVKEGLDSWIG